MRERNWNGSIGYEKLQAYFFDRIEPLYRAVNKKPMIWDELFLAQTEYKLPNDTIVEVWRSHEGIYKSVQAGFKTVFAYGFYLDVQSPNLHRVRRYRWIDTWRDFYENEPFRVYNFTQPEKDLVIGGEGCMWSENVDDTNIDSRVWPRALAIAERLWSPQYINNTVGARIRLERQRCVMLRRGIHGGPSIEGRHYFCDAHYKL